MKKITVLLFCLALFSSGISQTNMEVSIPIGLSNIHPNTIDHGDYDFINETLKTNRHISTGLEVRLAPWSLKHFEFFFAASYLRMQYRASQELEQESYSWTYKNTRITHADHYIGINAQARYNFITLPAHKLGIQLKLGYLVSTASETWVTQEVNSYFGNGLETYKYYLPQEEPDLDLPASYYAGFAYTYGQGSLRWIFEMGYNYLDNPETDYLNRQLLDWSNIQLAAGIKYYFISPEEKVINSSKSNEE